MDKFHINRRQLIYEIGIILTIIFAITMLRFIPWVFSQTPPSPDPYASNKILYDAVSQYDYSAGRDSELESRLERGTTDAIDEDNGLQISEDTFYFNLLAKADYYAHFGYYRRAYEAADLASLYAPDQEERVHVLALLDRYEAQLK